MENYVVGAHEAENVAKEIEGFGVRAYAHEADVSDEDQVTAMVARMVEEFGTIDIMVANEGLQRDAAVTEMTLAQWQKAIDVNLSAVWQTGSRSRCAARVIIWTEVRVRPRA